MKQFSYTITDPIGIHARPAGLLVREVKKYPNVEVTLSMGERCVNALKLMALMQMNIKQGDTVLVSVEGQEEEAVANALERFFRDAL